MVPFDDRRIKFPLLSSVASPPVASDDEFPAALIFVIQRSWPLVSDRARLDPFVKASVAEEGLAIGIARLATHTTLSLGMFLYHIPT